MRHVRMHTSGFLIDMLPSVHRCDVSAAALHCQGPQHLDSAVIVQLDGAHQMPLLALQDLTVFWSPLTRPYQLQERVNGTGSDVEEEFTGGLFDQEAGGSAWEAAAPVLTPKPKPRPAQPKKQKGLHAKRGRLGSCLLLHRCLGSCAAAQQTGCSSGVHR
jgi:hypothetical protein